MMFWTLIYENPWKSLVLVPLVFLSAGFALAQVATAITEPLAPCRRGNCPRCNGTGSETRVRRGETTP